MDLTKRKIVVLEAANLPAGVVIRGLLAAEGEVASVDDRLMQPVTISLHSVDCAIGMAELLQACHAQRVEAGDGVRYMPRNDEDWLGVKAGPVEKVLRRLAAISPGGYYLDPDINGSVSIDSRGLTVSQVLARIASQAGAVCVETDGFVAIVPPARLDEQDMQGRALDTIVPRVEIVTMDVREALRWLIKWAGISYSMAPEVQGTVSLHAKGIRLGAALSDILSQVGSGFRVEAGVIEIVRNRH